METMIENPGPPPAEIKVSPFDANYKFSPEVIALHEKAPMTKVALISSANKSAIEVQKV